jgi:hypothetical protein
MTPNPLFLIIGCLFIIMACLASDASWHRAQYVDGAIEAALIGAIMVGVSFFC